MNRTAVCSNMAIAVAIAALPTTGFAQVVQEEAAGEVIIVTAQKRAQNVQEVPLAVSVATGDDLERLQVGNINNLQYSTPSLVVAGSDPTRKRFGIRGVADQSRNAGFDNRIGVYVDGVWAGRSAASNQGVLDIASIEILRGPQGTLFGKNTVAGAINILTERPKSGYFGYVEGGLGNYDLRQTRGMVNLGFSDQAAARVSGAYTKRDGFTKSLSNGLDYDNRNDYAFRGQLQIKTGTTTFYIAGDTTKYDYRALPSGEKLTDTGAAAALRVITIDGEQKLNLRYSGISGQVDHEFSNGGTLTSISGYRTSRYSGSSDEDFSPLTLALATPVGEETKHFSQELRYASPDSGKFDYVFGFYFLDQDIKGEANLSVFAKAINPAAPAIFVDAGFKSHVWSQAFAAFAHANYRFSDIFQLTFGARMNNEKKDAEFQMRDTSRLFTNGSMKDKRSSTDFSPTLSLNFFPADDVMAYARYARGYKSGGWNLDFVTSVNPADLRFDDESVDAFEVGLKTMAFDRRLRLNLAAYVSKHKDYQVFSFLQLSTGGTVLSASNAGKVTSKGFEVEAELTATDWLSLFANYGYNDAKFDSFKGGGGVGVDFDGNRLPDAPKHNLNLGMRTSFDIGFANFVTQADYNYRDAFYSNPNNAAVNLSNSLEQVNLRAGFEVGNFSIFGWMRNAFNVDKQIYSSVSFLGVRRAQINDPQTYGVTFKMKFGA